MANRILTDRGMKKMIREIYHCSFPTIKSALDGSEVTALQKRIRIKALELGGLEVVPLIKGEKKDGIGK